MKRPFLYVLILATLLLVPLERAEIAKLEPVQGVWLYKENGMVVLETDTEDTGVGITVEEALQNMKQNSAGIIYLDTAQYLFVTNAEDQIPAMKQYLKESVRVCSWTGETEISEAVQYADAHKIGMKLQNWNASVKLPKLPI